MKNRYLFSILTATALLFSACTDYLQENPTTSFTASFVYNTPEGLESGVVAIYNLHRSFYENLAANGSNAIVIDAKD
ncbi:MAG TPA: hypothetical protein PKD85_11275, partial [Saprospiraceae bacterium]|nr:hypothetical protein [Saprospiraceae bacterium]